MTARTRWIRIFLGLFGVAFILSILLPIFGRSGNSAKRFTCPSNLIQLGLGMAQYIQDYDQRLPLAKSERGWADAVYPYIKSTQVFHCPSAASPPQPVINPRFTGYTDYYYNSQLQRRLLNDIGGSSRLILVGEGNDGQESTDASYSKQGIPLAWRTDSSSPAFRHLGTANYLFIDGHVKGLKEGDISANWDAQKFFFQPPKLIDTHHR